MHFPEDVVGVIRKVSPVLGTALGGPAGGLVGSLISSILGVDMNNHEEVSKKIDNDPECQVKLRELELQFKDLQTAREEASKEQGFARIFRPMMVIVAYISLFIDLALIKYCQDELIRQILILFTGVLILDIRQMHKLYFGSGEDTRGNFLLSNIFKLFSYRK